MTTNTLMSGTEFKAWADGRAAFRGKASERADALRAAVCDLQVGGVFSFPLSDWQRYTMEPSGMVRERIRSAIRFIGPEVVGAFRVLTTETRVFVVRVN